MTRQRATMDEEGLRQSLVLSGALHLAVLLFLYFGLPHFYTPLPTPSMPVPFEIVELADLTNTRVKEPDQPEPPAPPPKPEVKAAAAPQPPAPQPQPAAQPKAPDQVEALLPKPAEKPKPPAPAKPHEDMLASVLKDVSKMKASEATKTPDQKTPDQAKDEAKSMAPSLSSRLTISEEDALRRQIEQYWNMPIGARDAQNLVVEVTITVNPDRTVASAEVLDKSRVATDPYFRSAAEAALRALERFRYEPLDLPADKYDQWKNIDFTFDPRDML